VIVRATPEVGGLYDGDRSVLMDIEIKEVRLTPEERWDGPA
jgi:hypothetical protein